MAKTPTKKNGVTATIGLGVSRWLAADYDAKHLTDDKRGRYGPPPGGGRCMPRNPDAGASRDD